MSTDVIAPDLSPVERRSQVAAILAKGMSRWHRRMKSSGLTSAAESGGEPQNSLDLSDDLRLSVPDRTAG